MSREHMNSADERRNAIQRMARQIGADSGAAVITPALLEILSDSLLNGGGICYTALGQYSDCSVE